MNKTKKNWKGALILGLILLFMMSVTALASSDNSLSALNVENGTVSPDFVYSTWEYDVKVAPGTTELILNRTDHCHRREWQRFYLHTSCICG